MKTWVVLLLLFAAKISTPAEVQLPNGVIRGREDITINNKTFYAFEKIPYAAPPVGVLRFKPPVPPQNWSNVLNTTILDVICFQRNTNDDSETEDCLYLNIFTPLLPNGTSTVLPVMVYIHGGGFVAGTARGIYANRFINQDVIFATINYRLGPFGFTSTEDDVIPGNNGLKDQLLALQWIHTNIHLFGGDSQQITIFGQSTGSASCAYHLLNQKSQGLFRAAILQSGTFLSPLSFQRNPREVAFATAAFLDSSFKTKDNSTELLEFLQNVDAHELDKASEQYYIANVNIENAELLQGFFWAPVIEPKNPDAFLTKKMYKLLEAGNVVTVPILIGFTSEEAIGLGQDTNNLRNEMEAYDTNLSWLVPHDMQITNQTTLNETGEVIRQIYTKENKFVDNLGAGIRYYSDSSLSRPIIRTAQLYSKLAPTYFYQFSYEGEINKVNVTYEDAGHVGHGSDLAYIFSGDVSKYPDADRTTVDRMVNLWTNFAKYLNPTPEKSDLLQNIIWSPISGQDGDLQYLDIGSNLEIKKNPKSEAISEWIRLYNSLDFDDFDTY